MGLSEDVTQLVTEAKRSKELIRPYSGDLVLKLRREMMSLYRAIETGFHPGGAFSSNSSLTLSQPISSSYSSSNNFSQDPETISLMSSPTAIHIQHLAYFLGIHRIKRALLIYHKIRLQAMQQTIWITGRLPTTSQYTGIATPPRSRELSKNNTHNAYGSSGTPRKHLDNRYASASNTPISRRNRELLKEEGLRDSPRSLKKPKPITGLVYSNSSPRRSSYLIEDTSSNLSPSEQTFGMAYKLLMHNVSLNFPLIDLMGSLEPPKEVLLEIRVLRDCGEIMTESGPIRLETGSQLYVRKTDVSQLLVSGDVKAI